MIDVETAVYARVADALRKKYGKNGIYVAGEYVDSPSKFPAVTILEADNRVYEKQRTDYIENAAKLLYEVNIYSNKLGYKKSEAQEILNIVDQEMAGMGFTRTMASPASNLQDATIFRMIVRYEGVVDKEYRIYTH